MHVRPYRTDDFDQVIALYRNKQAYGGNFDESRDTAERLEATANQGDLYVACVDDVVVGTFMVLANLHSFWLLRFAVDPAHPDAQQVADALAEKASLLAKERGHESVIVYTDADNQQLQVRYVKSGFHESENYRCFWKEA